MAKKSGARIPRGFWAWLWKQIEKLGEPIKYVAKGKTFLVFGPADSGKTTLHMVMRGKEVKIGAGAPTIGVKRMGVGKIGDLRVWRGSDVGGGKEYWG